jgi:hypothetical protein
LSEERPEQTAPAGLVVLGVAGSGTSIAGQIAATIGLAPPSGDLMGADRYNPTGYWESRALSRLDDLLLSQWRCNWWLAPPAITPEMVYRLRGFTYLAAGAFVGTFPQAPWMWKDPRLTVLLPFWDHVLGSQPLLFVHRTPGTVARSLEARDGFGTTHALAIWERHTRLALSAMAGHRVLVSSYERLWSDPDRWRSELAAYCADAGLPVELPSDRVDAVVTRDSGLSEIDGVVSRGQVALFDIVRSLEGPHRSFPRLDLPPEDKTVSETIASLWRRTLRRSTKTYLTALG